MRAPVAVRAASAVAGAPEAVLPREEPGGGAALPGLPEAVEGLFPEEWGKINQNLGYSSLGVGVPFPGKNGTLAEFLHDKRKRECGPDIK